MNILAFDTCFGACSVAVTWWDRVELAPPKQRYRGSASRFERLHKGHAERLMPMIEEVLVETPIGIEQVERIVVTLGPGTFTGVRIGVAAARAFALATGAKVHGAGSLHLMSRQACATFFQERCAEVLGPEAGEVPRWLHEEFARKDVAIAVDARRDEVYFQLFGGDLHRPLTEPLLVAPDRALSLLRERETLVAGSGGERLCAAARKADRDLVPQLADLEPNARYLAGMGDTENLDPPHPVYLRPPDARPQDGKSLARAS
jgi:tRNA threonylcarbamoyladenosine biosynthesis protein TsaB